LLLSVGEVKTGLIRCFKTFSTLHDMDGKMKFDKKTIAGTVLLSVVFALAIFLAYSFFDIGVASKKPSTTVEPAPSLFTNKTNPEITRTLMIKNIQGCGFLKWAPNPGKSNEYTVKCSTDGENWFTYLVWPKINEVSGPTKHEVVKEPASYLTDAEKAQPKVERAPLPNQDISTIPYIDKLGDCLAPCSKLPPDESDACKNKCYSLYK